MVRSDNSNDQELDNYNKNFRESKKLRRKLKNYGVKGLKLIALSPFLSILVLRIFQVLLGISYIIYFLLEPCFYYILIPGTKTIIDYVSCDQS